MAILMQSWFSLFTPSALRQFILATVRRTQELLVTLLRMWWWVIIGYVALIIIAGALESMSVLTVLGLLQPLILPLLVLCARASIAKKDYAYFAGYWRHLIYIYVLFGIVRPLILGLLTSCPDICFIYWGWSGLFFEALHSFLALLFMCFWFDSQGRIQDLLRSFARMFIVCLYQLPMFLCITILFFLIDKVALNALSFVFVMHGLTWFVFIPFILSLFFALISVAMVVVFYSMTASNILEHN